MLKYSIKTIFLFAFLFLFAPAKELFGDTGVIVPFYIYPTAAAIQPVLDAKSKHPQVSIRVILNPNSGPGTSIDANYVNAVHAFKLAGILVDGYVPTGYAQTDPNTVKTQISQWINWYNPEGIFLDEMGVNNAYYNAIISYAKTLGITTVIGNPGAANTGFYGWLNIDILNIYENSQLPTLSNFTNWKLYGFPPSRLSMIAYNINHLPVDFTQQVRSDFGWIYLTDNSSNTNPYNTLPTYFEDLVALLDILNALH